jgi:hypothetical protein
MIINNGNYFFYFAGNFCLLSGVCVCVCVCERERERERERETNIQERMFFKLSGF